MASDRNGNTLKYMDAVAIPDFLLNGERRAYVQGRYLCPMFKGLLAGKLKVEVNSVEVHLEPAQIVLWSAFVPTTKESGSNVDT